MYKSHQKLLILFRQAQPLQRSLFLQQAQQQRFFATIPKQSPISDTKLKELLKKHKEEQERAIKFVQSTQNTQQSLSNQSSSPSKKGQPQTIIPIKAVLNEHGELDIDFDNIHREINKSYKIQRSKQEDEQLAQQQSNDIKQAEKMSSRLNFENMAKVFQGYTPVGSAKMAPPAKPRGKRGRPPKKKEDLKSATQEGNDDNNLEELPQPQSQSQKGASKEEAKKARGRPRVLKEIKRIQKKMQERDDEHEIEVYEKLSDQELLDLEKEGIDRKSLNEQDLMDLREIKDLEKIAKIRQKQGISIDQEQEDVLNDQDLMLDEEIKQKQLKQMKMDKYREYATNDISLEYDEEGKPLVLTQTDFLTVVQIPGSNSIKATLMLPKYDLDENQQLQKQNFDIIFDYEQMEKIYTIFQNYKDICAYTDGSSIRNPGRGGSAVAFFGRLKNEEVQDIQQELGGTSDILQERKKRDDREFLFGISLNLGIASNNYAEYVGVILAQLVFSMFRQYEISIFTDSTLIVNQIKGIARTKNFRLVELIKIVHALAFKFTSMGLDYVQREYNTIADALAREGSGNMVSLTGQIYQFHFKLEKLIGNAKIK